LELSVNCHFKRTLLATLVAQLFTVNAFADETPQAENAVTDTQTIVIDAKRIVGSVSKQTQEDAPNLVNVITAEEIRQLPDINAGEAVRRLPGVSLEGDTGEGRYVYIRGLDADFNGTTFNGIRLLPTNPASPVAGGGGRAVAFDVIPSGMVGSIKVTKTNLPEQDAEAIGGTIEITSKQMPLDGKPFINGHIGTGFEPLGNSAIGDFNFTAGMRFGGGGDKKDGEITTYSDKPFSIVVTGSYYEDSRAVNDVEPSTNGGLYGQANGAIGTWDERYYQYNRKRHGVGLDLGYQPDANNTYYFRAFDSGYKEKKLDNILSPDGTGGIGSLSLTRKLADHKETLDNQTFSLGGKNVFDGKALDYFVAYGKGSYKVNADATSKFVYQTSDTLSFNNTGAGGTPIWQPTGDQLNPNNYLLKSLKSNLQFAKDDEYSTGINFKLPVKLANFQEETMKVGVNARFRTHDSSNQYLSASIDPTATMANFVSGPPVSFYNGQYNMGQLITPGLLQQLYPINKLDANGSLLSQQHDTENVYATYAQYEFKQDRLGVIGGLRYEQTEAKYGANGSDASGNNVIPYSNNSSYGNLFPSIQAKYELDKASYLRAAFSSTIARPTFAQINPAVSSNPGGAPGGGTAVSTGNPNLKPNTANSFDLSLERYLDNAGIISIGIFDKELSNYIASRTSSTSSVNVLGLTGPALYTTFENIGSATVKGVEFNYEQRYKQLPGILSGLGTSFNYTYVDSKFEQFPGVYSAIPGTSKDTVNASVFYAKDKFFFKVAAYYASASIWTLGNNSGSPAMADAGGNVNQMYDKRFSLDIGASYQYDKNISFYLSGKNLTNDPMTYYYGTKANTIQREYYGATYLTGINFTY
jgi:TonB-dependent receptor